MQKSIGTEYYFKKKHFFYGNQRIGEKMKLFFKHQHNLSGIIHSMCFTDMIEGRE